MRSQAINEAMATPRRENGPWPPLWKLGFSPWSPFELHPSLVLLYCFVQVGCCI